MQGLRASRRRRLRQLQPEFSTEGGKLGLGGVDDIQGLLLAIDDKLGRDNPVLIVLDTFARCFVGGEENSAKDVGEAISVVAQVQTETGATVLAVHHTGWNQQERERGSSALRGAADVMIRMVSKGAGVEVTNEKQKDGEEFRPILLKLEERMIDSVVGDGKPNKSCVLRLARAGEGAATGLSFVLKTALEALDEFRREGAKSGA